MILGLSIPAFTALHTILSLIGIAAGLVVLAGLLKSNDLDGWTAIFLATTFLTSATGFLFPRDQVLPSHVVGVLTLMAVAAAGFALYGRGLAGNWRWIYVFSATVALYFNVFVAVVQAFLKLPFLHPLAPNGTEPPFVAAQLTVLILFVALGIAALRSFHPATAAHERR